MLLQHLAGDAEAFQRLGHAAIDADDMAGRPDLLFGHAVAERAPAMGLLFGHLAERADHGEVHRRAGLRVDGVVASAEAPAPGGHRLLERPSEIVGIVERPLDIVRAQGRSALDKAGIEKILIDNVSWVGGSAAVLRCPGSRNPLQRRRQFGEANEAMP